MTIFDHTRAARVVVRVLDDARDGRPLLPAGVDDERPCG